MSAGLGVCLVFLWRGGGGVSGVESRQLFSLVRLPLLAASLPSVGVLGVSLCLSDFAQPGLAACVVWLSCLALLPRFLCLPFLGC